MDARQATVNWTSYISFLWGSYLKKIFYICVCRGISEIFSQETHRTTHCGAVSEAKKSVSNIAYCLNIFVFSLKNGFSDDAFANSR